MSSKLFGTTVQSIRSLRYGMSKTQKSREAFKEFDVASSELITACALTFISTLDVSSACMPV